MKKVAIGKIVKTIGLNGEVKVISLSDFASKRFKIGKKIELLNELDNNSLETVIERARFYRGTYILKFKGLDTIDSVLPFLNFLLVIDKDLAIQKSNSYYFDDLVNCKVVNEANELLGIVIKVEDHPAHQTLRVMGLSDKHFFVPFVHFYIKDVNIESKIITIHEIKGLI